ncbi:MAG: hypothetical protein WKF37_01835 [Bryobacteraceae bacterium]
MPVSVTKYLSVMSSAVLLSAAIGSSLWGQAQPAPGQAPAAQGTPAAPGQTAAAPGTPAAPGAPAQKNYKDTGEYELYAAITKADTTPAKRLELLDQWKQKYAATDFKKERMLLYLDTYQKLGKAEDMVKTAGEILQDDPKDFTALFWISSIVPTLPGAATNPAHQDAAEKAARGMLENLDATFAAEKKPAATSEEQWKKGRSDMQAVAYKALGWTAMVKKNDAAAEENLRKALEVNPNDATVSYWMSTTLMGQKKIDLYMIGLYHLARAVTYDGPGALSPEGRKQLEDSLNKGYKGYHGDVDGLPELKAQTKASALPPAGFKIPTSKDVALGKIEQEQKLAAANPELALWKSLKTELSGPNGTQYFEGGLKEAAGPKLRGKVVSTTAKTIGWALSDETTPEVTLQLDSPVGKVEPGTELVFEGAVGKTFTPSPFMVTMGIERSKVEGLPAASAPAKKAGGAKKPAARRRR